MIVEYYKGQFEANVTGFHAIHRGLYPKLNVGILLQPTQEYSILSNGLVEFGLENTGIVFGKYPLFDTSNYSLVNIWRTPGNRNKAYFEIELIPAIIMVIEESRNGGNIYFQGRIIGNFLTVEENGKSIKSLWWGEYTLRGVDSNKIELPASKWHELCNELGLFNKHTLEIISPHHPNSANLQKVAEYIIKANENFQKFEYDHVLINCRKAIELLDKKFSEFKSYASSSSQISQNRLSKMIDWKNKLKELTNKAAHSGEGLPINRHEARLILISTQLWISYVENVILHSIEK